MEKRGEGMAVWGKWRQSEVKNGERKFGKWDTDDRMYMIYWSGLERRNRSVTSGEERRD